MERNEECMSGAGKATRRPPGLITWTLCSDGVLLFSGKRNGLKTNNFSAKTDLWMQTGWSMFWDDTDASDWTECSLLLLTKIGFIIKT